MCCGEHRTTYVFKVLETLMKGASNLVGEEWVMETFMKS